MIEMKTKNSTGKATYARGFQEGLRASAEIVERFPESEEARRIARGLHILAGDHQ